MNLAALLNDYLKGIGQADHSGSSEGSLFEITLNDVLSIRVSELAGPPTMVCLQYEVGSVPLDADSDFFRRCLHANFQARSAFDACIAINEANSVLALLVRYPLADLDSERFQTMLEDFSAQAQRLFAVMSEHEYASRHFSPQPPTDNFTRV